MDEPPKSIDITTNIGCRIQCKFCPQDVSMTNYAEKNELEKITFAEPVQMPYSTFLTIIKKIPKDVLIRFSGFSEPFLNPECVKMIKFASDQGYKIQIYSTLVGLKDEDIETLENVNMHKFVIHLADIEKFAKIALPNHNKLLKKIMSSKIKNVFFMTMGTIDEETKEIIGMNVKSSLMVDWAGHNEYGQKVDRIKGPILCSMHRSLKNEYIPPIILPNGDTLLCCKDWSMEYILGNLKNCDYDELFTSEKFKDIVKKMRSENENILCRNCEFAISIDEQNKLKKNYEKLEINPNDEIGKKLDDMYQNLLNRTIDPEGLIFYYNEIKNNNVSYTDIENQIKSSKEYASIPKKKEN